MRLGSLFPLLVLVAASVMTDKVHGQPTLSRRMTGGNRRTNYYEVTFSDAEEAVLKGNQRQTPEAITGLLNGRSVQEVQRRCVELGLRCGDSVNAPAKNSEKWRRRGQ